MPAAAAVAVHPLACPPPARRSPATPLGSSAQPYHRIPVPLRAWHLALEHLAIAFGRDLTEIELPSAPVLGEIRASRLAKRQPPNTEPGPAHSPAIAAPSTTTAGHANDGILHLIFSTLACSSYSYP